MNIDEIIKNRKTQKVLANTHLPVHHDHKKLHITINELLELASSAPYHKKCNSKYLSKEELNSCLPWRSYVLDSINCRSLSNLLVEKEIKSGKINDMLSASDALLLVTWLPEPLEQNQTEDNILFSGNLQNMEHIAAASAAIQNILIGATARALPNYWSSGGVLRTEKIKKMLHIPEEEILLGAIFLFPSKLDEANTFVKTGALRNQGKKINTWTKWVEIAKTKEERS